MALQRNWQCFVSFSPGCINYKTDILRHTIDVCMLECLKEHKNYPPQQVKKVQDKQKGPVMIVAVWFQVNADNKA